MMKVKEEVRRALFSHKVCEIMSEVGVDRRVCFQLKQTIFIIGMLSLYLNAIFDIFMNLKEANLTWMKVSALFY